MNSKSLLCLALVLSDGLFGCLQKNAPYVYETNDTAVLYTILPQLNRKVPELSVESLSQAPYITHYTSPNGRLEIIAKAYDSEKAAKDGQESDARGISVNADKTEVIKGVRVYEYTRYGGLYFQKGCYTFRFETFHGGNDAVQRFLLKVCSALISELDSTTSKFKQP